jgi:hypothetical protein
MRVGWVVCLGSGATDTASPDNLAVYHHVGCKPQVQSLPGVGLGPCFHYGKDCGEYSTELNGMPTSVSLFVWPPEERAKWVEMRAKGSAAGIGDT